MIISVIEVAKNLIEKSIGSATQLSTYADFPVPVGDSKTQCCDACNALMMRSIICTWGGSMVG